MAEDEAVVHLDDKGKDVWKRLMRRDFAKFRVDENMSTMEECFFYMGERSGTYLFIMGPRLEGGVYSEGIPYPVDGNFEEQFSKNYTTVEALWEFMDALPSGVHFRSLLTG